MSIELVKYLVSDTCYGLGFMLFTFEKRHLIAESCSEVNGSETRFH